MNISHELPLSLLENSKSWNDYEYLLPCFVDKYDEYRLHFQKARLNKRFIIMDNSLFEGYVHTTEDLLSKIEWLQPDIFIVPDAWNDAERLYHKINCGKLLGKIWIVKLEGDKDIADLQGKINEDDIKQLD